MAHSRISDLLAKRALSGVLKAIGEPPIALALGEQLRAARPSAPLLGTVTIKDWPTLLGVMLEPEYGFGEGFARGRIEVEGDLPGMLEAVYRAMDRGAATGLRQRLRRAWFALRNANTRRGSRRNIHHHYDIDTDFYRLWLDAQLLYTCAYFPSPEVSLEEAQAAKMDLVCRKVRLAPGDTVAEAGCGWGALALHMAREYGAKVRAYNISHEQIVWARERARQEELEDRVEFIEDDYRNIAGTYDVFMSVGMLEHVGAGRYRTLGRVIDRCLKDDGRGLLHFIGRNRPRPLNTWINRRIFPGAYPPALREAMGVFELQDFSILDVENLRLHYARTLEHWLRRYEASMATVTQMFDEEFARAWRLYLAGSVAGFRAGSLQLFQVVFARGRNNRIPWTRDYMYSDATPAARERVRLKCDDLRAGPEVPMGRGDRGAAG